VADEPASETSDWTLLLAAIGAVALLYGLAETFNRSENRR
jgi:hypothetical protein